MRIAVYSLSQVREDRNARETSIWQPFAQVGNSQAGHSEHACFIQLYDGTWWALHLLCCKPSCHLWAHRWISLKRRLRNRSLGLDMCGGLCGLERAWIRVALASALVAMGRVVKVEG